MTTIRSVEQTDPPRSPRETLPTMYDLKSEDPEEPGLPDEYHDLQPQLLSRTFRPRHYPQERIFTASDLNLYYDVHNPRWYKRPDWFVTIGVPRLYDEKDLRLSYVVWQEGMDPFIVVELLSPGTENEDLGRYAAEDKPAVQTEAAETPPRKWDVYEQILRIPYYVVFSRYTNQMRVFTLVAGRYQEQTLAEPRLWIPELEIGLGLWSGEYEGVTRPWLRWYDNQRNWIPTDTEQERQQAEQAQAKAEQERQRADQERQRADQAEQRLQDLLENLRKRGIDPGSL